MASGLHHLTSITADVQANVDFYAGFLGLSLVKQRGGFEDIEQLHLYYGDAAGSPGSLMSFHVWPGAGRGRTGIGQVSELAFAVPRGAIGHWLARALEARVPIEGPSREFGAPVLRLKDPDGLIVKLVGEGEAEGSAIARLHSVTLLLEEAAEMEGFLGAFGYAREKLEGSLIRLASASDRIDLRVVTGYVPSAPGAGVPDHLALRVAAEGELEPLRCQLMEFDPGAVADETHFHSFFLRGPAEMLFEAATDGPGMGADEAPDSLGSRLFVPEDDAARAAALRVRLPQFALPGEDRFPQRDLPFLHRLYCPADPDGSTLILLHDNGGSEADLFPFAHAIAPRALLIGLRGRATEERSNRFFRREGFLGADQADLRAEAEAFAGFLEGATRGYGLETGKIVFIGHGNGAELLAAAMLLGLVPPGKAILLRAGLPLEKGFAPRPGSLAGSELLLLDGAKDLFVTTAKPLLEALSGAGAAVEALRLPGGHELGAGDTDAASGWLAARL